VAEIDGIALNKPGTRENAISQLQLSSGKAVLFHTGLSVSLGARSFDTVVTYTVHFRHLDLVSIKRYLDAEKPYDCAGSFKSEGLGISLFQRLEGDDPNALIGLPLIKTCEFLRVLGIDLP